MSKTAFIALLMFTIIVIIVVFKESKSDTKSVVLKENALVLAFGDSLTYGFGVSKEFSYPSQMEKKSSYRVINAGINGELSSEGLLRLPSLLQKYKPEMVILCHGGNDILNKLPSTNLKNNLLAMIKLIENSGSKVLLVGVPDFSYLSFSTHDIYEEVADETDVVFEDEVLTEIESNRALKSDYVHPNAKGYEMMAEAFLKLL